MKKLHSFALCALVTPVITLGASSALAQQTTGQDIDRQTQTSQRDYDTNKSTQKSSQGDHRSAQGELNSQNAAEHRNANAQSKMDNRGHIASVPTLGMRASDLIGAQVSTAIDNDVGPVDDLIIDENGQVVAIVVGVGGFLGMGEKDVAIGWDHVTKSGTGDEQKLRIDVTREDLRSAPEFEEDEE